MNRIYAPLFIVAMPSTALAADPTGVSTVLSGIAEVVYYALGILLMGLVSILVKKIADKFKVSIPEAWMQGANVMIDKGIHFAEEKTKNLIKDNNEKLSSNDKLNVAVDFILSMTDDKKLIEMGREKLRNLIEARLNQNKTSVIGAVVSTNPQTNESPIKPAPALPVAISTVPLKSEP